MTLQLREKSPRRLHHCELDRRTSPSNARLALGRASKDFETNFFDELKRSYELDELAHILAFSGKPNGARLIPLPERSGAFAGKAGGRRDGQLQAQLPLRPSRFASEHHNGTPLSCAEIGCWP